ncbi:hypothetical protein [Pseudaestuariivita atlantica]|uniref:Dihydrodipicolinate reductase n=1 Tax=Pseudaestuariivita atlantica TaxID=1317121 RepID=A0A0L1JSU8_9RHOB|nr:hypothetical protein [Pseudaestuariivita atlantica]KNG94859.1 hypothetical protein ATO11_05620 [Pseudaestuariivita atlantica]
MFTTLRLGLAACLTAMLPAMAAAELAKLDSRSGFVTAVAGKTLAIPLYGIRLQVSGDGKIRGKAVGRPVKGDWTWQGGFFCRTLFWGEREFPYNCQRVDLGGDTIRFTSDRGAGRSADFDLR